MNKRGRSILLLPLTVLHFPPASLYPYPYGKII